MMQPENSLDLPLDGLRVIELSDGKGEMCGRVLADLGAEVTLIEPPGGSAARRAPPLVDGHSLYFATHNANKRSLVLDLACAAGRDELLNLVGGADILVESLGPGRLQGMGLGAGELHARQPALVILSISDFGHRGPYHDYQANNAVLMALGGVLARSGIKGQHPLLPPGQLAHETAPVQAAWVALMAYLRARDSGRGDHLDFSLLDATIQIIDPGMGVTGSAAAGRSALEIAPRGRPPMGTGYPIFRCADGHVRICVLNPRQWQGMCGWLGDAHPFTDPAFGHIGKRFKGIKEINALIAALFSDQRAAALGREGEGGGASGGVGGGVVRGWGCVGAGAAARWPARAGPARLCLHRRATGRHPESGTRAWRGPCGGLARARARCAAAARGTVGPAPPGRHPRAGSRGG